MNRNGVSLKKILRNLDADYADKIFLYDRIDSTNNKAKELAKSGVKENKIIIAKTQTAGRGRVGRSFYSENNNGIYMSFLLKHSYNESQTVLITTAAALLVLRAIKRVTNAEVGIKWVNDLYLNGKKICGILTETINNAKTGTLEWVVIGIGINCGDVNFPDEIKDIAGSLGKVDTSRLVAEIIREIGNIFEIISTTDYIEEYRKNSIVIGKKIVILGNENKIAEAIDIDKNGGLVVKTEEGKIETLSSGEISIRLCENSK